MKSKVFTAVINNMAIILRKMVITVKYKMVFVVKQ